MRGVKRADTKPEMLVRSALDRRGYRFALRRKDLPGKPDIVLTRHKAVVMVHGCFWHQHASCKDGRVPGSNIGYWSPKLRRNKERDAEKQRELEALGWTVHTIWECEVKNAKVLDERIKAISP